MKHATKAVWLLSAGALVLLAGHGILLYYVVSHTIASAAVVSGVIVLVVFKHLGLLGPFYALLRRCRFRCLPKKIISGGQTGADIGALMAAHELRIETGGFAPKGWLTENGPQEVTLRGFRLREWEAPGYPERTRANVIHSDGTLLVGDYDIGGTRLTDELAREVKKPIFRIASTGLNDPKSDALRVEEFRSWIRHNHIAVLNVAGNRESETPGIAEFTRAFLIKALRQN